jgi:hypothetical protein
VRVGPSVSVRATLRHIPTHNLLLPNVPGICTSQNIKASRKDEEQQQQQEEEEEEEEEKEEEEEEELFYLTMLLIAVIIYRQWQINEI